MKQLFNKYSSTFIDPVLEKKYKEKQTKPLTSVLKFSLIIFFLNICFLFYSDFFLNSNSYEGLKFLFSLRFFILVYTLIVLFILKKANYKTNERLVFVFFILISLTNFIRQLTNPNPEMNHYTLEVMASFAIYLMFPIKIRFQVAGALLYSASNLVSLDAEVQSIKIYYHTLIMFCNANILGYFFARYYHKTLRKIFFQIEEEDKISRELSKQKIELKKLSGIIPVCFKCHSIRDDLGYEKRLEEFVMDNSDVQFTHSMCPECAKRFLDEVKDIE